MLQVCTASHLSCFKFFQRVVPSVVCFGGCEWIIGNYRSHTQAIRVSFMHTSTFCLCVARCQLHHINKAHQQSNEVEHLLTWMTFIESCLLSGWRQHNSFSSQPSKTCKQIVPLLHCAPGAVPPPRRALTKHFDIQDPDPWGGQLPKMMEAKRRSVRHFPFVQGLVSAKQFQLGIPKLLRVVVEWVAWQHFVQTLDRCLFILAACEGWHEENSIAQTDIWQRQGVRWTRQSRWRYRWRCNHHLLFRLGAATWSHTYPNKIAPAFTQKTLRTGISHRRLYMYQPNAGNRGRLRGNGFQYVPSGNVATRFRTTNGTLLREMSYVEMRCPHFSFSSVVCERLRPRLRKGIPDCTELNVWAMGEGDFPWFDLVSVLGWPTSIRPGRSGTRRSGGDTVATPTTDFCSETKPCTERKHDKFSRIVHAKSGLHTAASPFR